MLRLNPQEQADCRHIAEIGSRLAVLLILFRLDRPLAARAVARLAHIHPTTASRYLQQLADNFGFADRQGSRWLITAAVQAFFELVKSALLSRDSAPPSISSFINRTYAKEAKVLTRTGESEYVWELWKRSNKLSLAWITASIC